MSIPKELRIPHKARRAAIRKSGREKYGTDVVKLMDWLCTEWENGKPVHTEPDLARIEEDAEIGKGKIWSAIKTARRYYMILMDDKGKGKGKRILWVALNPQVSTWVLKPGENWLKQIELKL